MGIGVKMGSQLKYETNALPITYEEIKHNLFCVIRTAWIGPWVAVPEVDGQIWHVRNRCPLLHMKNDKV